jgi:hypothetical protein
MFDDLFNYWSMFVICMALCVYPLDVWQMLKDVLGHLWKKFKIKKKRNPDQGPDNLEPVFFRATDFSGLARTRPGLSISLNRNRKPYPDFCNLQDTSI